MLGASSPCTGLSYLCVHPTAAGPVRDESKTSDNFPVPRQACQDALFWTFTHLSVSDPLLLILNAPSPGKQGARGNVWVLCEFPVRL